MKTDIDTLINQLDLTLHVKKLKEFFAREKPLYIQGDQELHFKYIKALDNVNFKTPPKVKDLTDTKNHLIKNGVLSFEQIFEIVKIVRYFRYFKNLHVEGIVGEWMDKIIIDERFFEVDKYFTNDGNFEENLDENLFRLSQRLSEHKHSISDALKKLIHTQKLSPYLVDTQIHYIDNSECLLLRGGFNHVLKGTMVGRSSAGHFYIIPQSISKLKEQIKHIQQQQQEIYYAYAKEFSHKLSLMIGFIKFIDKEFDRLDSYTARVMFAKEADLEILKAKKDSTIIIKDFIHPALLNAKPINVEFKKNILMITGVNAGGKTMLLKSILSSALMARYLIPMKLNPHKSHIGSFKHIQAIIDDPQNVKNDISTFAGRMQQFSQLFSYKHTLIGVDEIELGTDSDEAAALFKVILERLIKKHQKIIITTHHKRLASLMAEYDEVELLAALYDEANQKPTYEFMSGIVGKSYAFESAKRYGIPNDVVQEAKKVYGENSQKLNLLIERGSQLERELKQKHKRLDSELEGLRKKKQHLDELKEKVLKEFENEQNKLIKSYQEAIEEAKKAAKESDKKKIHRKMNEANKKLPKQKQKPKIKKQKREFKIGDFVKYRSQKGSIISIKDKKEAIVEIEGMRLRVKTKDLEPALVIKQKPKTDIKLDVEKKAGLKCDLHGLRSEEACEVLDKFLNDALLNGWDEVIIYHGIGTGKLSYAVKEFLKQHPRVKKFEDAPQHMGGFGAKVVTL